MSTFHWPQRVTVREVVGDKLGCGHFHDTRGLGMAKLMAALQANACRVRSRRRACPRPCALKK